MSTQGCRETFANKGTSRTFLLGFVLLAASLILSSCASPPSPNLSGSLTPKEAELLYQSPAIQGVTEPHIPSFLVKKPYLAYNRIGMPKVREKAAQQTEIIVAPEPAGLFYEKRSFTTAKGTYRNLVYRIHFEQVPFAGSGINITAGRNPGLLIIYTLGHDSQLLMVTTVHTCGCFLAFLPTSNLPEDFYPPDWPEQSQNIYGHILPSRLNLKRSTQEKAKGPSKISFSLESETHRISDVSTSPPHLQTSPAQAEWMVPLPMDKLYRLPNNDSTESFFEMDGTRKGYVRNNLKILERLLISWWAFDLHVGEDKAFGAADNSEVPLYTSLKFWNRQTSDLKNFPRFLTHWGWNF